MNTFNAGITLGALQSITCGSVANDSPTINTIVDSTSNQTVTLSKIGQTFILYRSTISPTLVGGVILHSTTISNTGIYTVNYQTRYGSYNLATRAKNLQSWIYVSSPTLYSGGGYGQLGLNSIGYVSPYLELAAVGASLSASWTGLINAGATCQLWGYLDYAVNNDGRLLDGISANYLSITRIA